MGGETQVRGNEEKQNDGKKGDWLVNWLDNMC